MKASERVFLAFLVFACIAAPLARQRVQTHIRRHHQGGGEAGGPAGGRVGAEGGGESQGDALEVEEQEQERAKFQFNLEAIKSIYTAPAACANAEDACKRWTTCNEHKFKNIPSCRKAVHKCIEKPIEIQAVMPFCSECLVAWRNIDSCLKETHKCYQLRGACQSVWTSLRDQKCRGQVEGAVPISTALTSDKLGVGVSEDCEASLRAELMAAKLWNPVKHLGPQQEKGKKKGHAKAVGSLQPRTAPKADPRVLRKPEYPEINI